MTVRFYSSSDAGAPALRGNTPGDLINVLDKCLVTGYGSKAAAGWTKPYTGTNVAAFRQGAGSNGMYLRIDDTSTATSHRHAVVVGYESMTDVNTGTPTSFPTTAQEATGLRWMTHYGSGSVANPRRWFVIADEMFFWLLINTYPENGDAGNHYQEAYCFGDIIPYKPGDTTHTVILGQRSGQNAQFTQSQPWFGSNVDSYPFGSSHGFFIARSCTSFGGPIYAGWHSDHQKGSSSFGSGQLSYPHQPDGGLYLAPVWVHEYQVAPYNVRGVVPGLWVPCHSVNIFSPHQVFDGQGELAGKQFMARRHGGSIGVCIEISNTWDR